MTKSVQKRRNDICHMEKKYSVTLRFRFILFRKQDREVQKLHPRAIPTLTTLGLYICSVHIPMRCSPLNTSVYSSSFRCTSVSNPFSIFRTVASMDACQFAVTASPLLAQHRKHTSTHVLHPRTVCCQTVRDCPRDYTKPIFIR